MRDEARAKRPGRGPSRAGLLSNTTDSGVPGPGAACSTPSRGKPGSKTSWGFMIRLPAAIARTTAHVVLIAVFAGACDVLAHLYHAPASLILSRYVVWPAVTAGMVSALAYLLLLPLVPLLAGTRGSKGSPWVSGQAALAACIGAGFAVLEWFEATPYFYPMLPRILAGAHLAAALSIHARLSLGPSDAEGRSKRIVLATVAYTGAAVNLGAWLNSWRIEEAFGEETMLLATEVAVVWGAMGLLSLAVAGGNAVASKLAGAPRSTLILSLVLGLLPAVLLMAAAYGWREHQLEVLELSRPGTAVKLMMLLGACTGGVVLVWRLMKSGGRAAAGVGLVASAGLGAAVWISIPGGEVQSVMGDARDGTARQIILLSVDTLRRDAIEPYGGMEVETPAFLRLAAESVVFEDAISPSSWTAPSMASVLTGYAPRVFGTINLHWKMSEATPTLAERMLDAGFQTAAIGHNGLLTDGHGFHQGFRQYDFYPRPLRPRTLGARVMNRAQPLFFQTEPTTTKLADRTLEWVARNRTRDFFLWVHIYDPHVPLGPPPAFLPEHPGPGTITLPWMQGMDLMLGIERDDPAERDYIRELYFAEVRYVDAELGRMMEGLKDLQVYDDALVVVLSDHGEELWERGRYGHGHSLYDELIRVPLMVKLPGAAQRGRRKSPVTTSSTAPTILELAGVEFGAEEFFAPSLAPLIRDAGAEWELRPRFTEMSNTELVVHTEGVRFAEWMVLTSIAPGRPVYVYDLSGDPMQEKDVAAENPEIVERGLDYLTEYGEASKSMRVKLGLDEADDGERTGGTDINTLRRHGYFN